VPLDRRALKDLRDASWQSVDELRGFVEQVGDVDRRDVEKLLATLTDPKIGLGPQHKNRCSAFKAICGRSADPSLFEPIANAFSIADPMLRRAMVAVLPKVNDVDKHELLCAQLGSTDRDVRRDVATVLEQVGGPSALRELTKLASRPSFPGRRDAIEVMVPKARHRALPLLAAVVKSGTTPDRLRALELLGDHALMHGDLGGALETVVDVLDDRDPNVSQAAFKAFASLADEETFFEALEPRVHEPDVSPVLVEALGHFPTKRSADLLSARMRRGPPGVQLAAIRALSAIGTSDVIGGLVDALHLEDPTLRRTAQDALFELGSSGKVDLAKLLLTLLASPMPHVRRAATSIASTIEGGGSLTEQLLTALREEDWWIREQVLDAIVELQLPELADGLVGFLSDDRPEIRRYAVFGLLRLRDPATLGAILRTAVTDPDWWVREQAVQAVGALGDDRAIPYIEALLDARPDLRVAAIETLMLLGADDVLMKNVELTAARDAAVRLAMLEALAKLDRGREVAFHVQACANDEEPSVAKLARELLDRWKIDAEAEGSASVGLLDRLLVATSRYGADDLLLSPGRPPFVKHLGQIQPISKSVLDESEMEKMVLPILSHVQREALEGGKDVDLSYNVPGFDLRFRINVFRQISGLSAVFRRVQQDLPSLDQLGLPDVVRGFADYPNGLVLVGGPTGSGKSTTLAALIGYINEHHGRHIVTIEDPIEFVHPQAESIVNQREVGSHAPTFAAALRATLRQDPDVILVGELRDRETIEFAVNAAETGHLVFATVHTTSAATSIDRLIHACEASRQPVIRSMLAESLRAVLCQQLLRRDDDSGRRVLACEVLVSNDAVANLVRKDKAFQLPSVITTSRQLGMRLMDDDLARLVREGVVDPTDAMLKAQDKGAFGELLSALEEGRKDQRQRPAPGSSVPPPGQSAPPGSMAPRTSFVPPKAGGGGGG